MKNESTREPEIRLLTREEFREATGLGTWKQRELERSGALRVVRLGVRTVRIASSEVARIAERAG